MQRKSSKRPSVSKPMSKSRHARTTVKRNPETVARRIYAANLARALGLNYQKPRR